jgi:hypothetical protein
MEMDILTKWKPILDALKLTDEKKSMPTKSFSIDLISENDFNPNYIEEIGENTLLHLLIDYLNEELETKNNLYITTMVNSISLVSSDGMRPKLILTSRCHVD